MGPDLDGRTLSISVRAFGESTYGLWRAIRTDHRSGLWVFKTLFLCSGILNDFKSSKERFVFVIHYLEHFGDIMVEPNLLVVTLLVEIKILKIN